MVEFGQGVNYAVVAATALDTSFHEARGTVNAAANVSLGDQLRWFKQSLPFICNNTSGNQTYICASTVYSCANHMCAKYLLYIGIIIFSKKSKILVYNFEIQFTIFSEYLYLL